MSEKNIERIELILTILLISIATIVSFNKACLLFLAVVFVRVMVAWILYKKNVYKPNAKKDFYSQLISYVILLFGILFIYIKYK